MSIRPQTIIIASLLASVAAVAEEAFLEDESSPANPVFPATCIPGPLTVSRFVPPVPPPPKDIPAGMRVQNASVRQFANHRAVVLRGDPSQLPDIPRPSPKPPPTPEEIAEREASHDRHRPPVQVNFNSVTYDGRISRVHWRHSQDHDIVYEALVAMDFDVFSNVGHYLHHGVPHCLFCLNLDIDTRILRRFGGWWQEPELPELPEGAFLVIRGDPQDAEGMHFLTSLMDLFAVEKNRLLEARSQRIQYEREFAEWKRLHPPEKPLASMYWLRPHRGSRYLNDAAGKGGER